MLLAGLQMTLHKTGIYEAHPIIVEFLKPNTANRVGPTQ